MAMPTIPFLARHVNRVVAWFETAGATAAPHAVAYTPPDPAGRRAFERLRAFHAIREDEAGRFWLDTTRLGHFRKEALAHALGAVGIAGLAAAAAIAFGR